MIEFLVKRPIAVIISFFAITALGIISFTHIPASLLPDIDIPKVVVKVKGDSQTASEIEQLLVAPIRSNLQQLNGIANIESKSAEGKGTITITFNQGTNSSTNFILVNEKVDLAMNRLPKEIERPNVIKAEVSNIPVFSLSIYPKEGDGQRSLVEANNLITKIICRRVEQMPEIAIVDVTGYVQPQIVIQPKYDFLKSVGVDQNIFTTALKDNNINLGNILIKDGHYEYYLKFIADLQQLSAIENISVNIQDRIFKLSDLAEVRYEEAPPLGAFYTNGHQAVNMAIIKQQGVKMSKLKSSFDTLLKHLRADYPELNFEITRDQTSLLDYAVSNLQQDLILGGLIAFLLMMVFIRKLRAAILIGITIPLSLAISQLGFYLFDISLNVISLGGLILGLAMIIDNSIVVIDNINNHMNRGLDIDEAIVAGTNEVIRPLITSVLTNCAVFIPLIFMSNLAGAIFYDQAVSITIGVVSSLIVSIILLPPLYKIVHRSNQSKIKLIEIRSYVNVTGWYEWGLKKVFIYPKTTCTVVFLLLGVSVLLFFNIKKEHLPPITRYDKEFNIDWNENISIEESKNRIALLVGKMRGIIEENVWIGEQQYLLPQKDEFEYTKAKIYFKVAKASQLKKIEKEFTMVCSEIFPLSITSFSSAKNAFDEIFEEEIPPLRVCISRDEENIMPAISKTRLFIEKVQKALPDVKIEPVALYDKVVLKVNTEQAALHKINIGDIAKKIETTFKPVFIDNFRDGQALVPIILEGKTSNSINELLSETSISNEDGAKIRLSILVSVDHVNEYKYITAGKQGEYYPLDIYTENIEKDLKLIKKIADKTNMKGLSFTYVGSYFNNQELISQMAFILLISVLLLYFILAAQFESLLQPLFILVELPIALSGALMSLYLAGNSLNIMSMIGIIVMCGLIINDSILKIDAINQLRKTGLSLMDSIYEGGHKRLKPIVMISLTSIGSLLPTLFMKDLGSELQKPLALTLIGGMLIGLFVSLFFVPLMYWFVYKDKGNNSDLFK